MEILSSWFVSDLCQSEQGWLAVEQSSALMDGVERAVPAPGFTSGGKASWAPCEEWGG